MNNHQDINIVVIPSPTSFQDAEDHKEYSFFRGAAIALVPALLFWIIVAVAIV